MRIIKFRAWDKNEYRMFSWEELLSIKYNPFWFRDNTNEDVINCIFTDRSYILMQFTGFHDKNGVEIYEGDIVEFTYWWFDGKEEESTLTGTIVYDSNSMSFQLQGVKNYVWEKYVGYSGDDYLTPFSEINFDEADFKVLGNIYEGVTK